MLIKSALVLSLALVFFIAVTLYKARAHEARAEASHPPLDPLYQLTSHSAVGPLAIPVLTAFVDDARIEAVIASVFVPQAPPAGHTAFISPG